MRLAYCLHALGASTLEFRCTGSPRMSERGFAFPSSRGGEEDTTVSYVGKMTSCCSSCGGGVKIGSGIACTCTCGCGCGTTGGRGGYNVRTTQYTAI